MNKDYLLLFLERRVFSLQSADDERLQKLRSAVEAVQETIGSDLSLTVPYTLIALDPKVPINDPAFEVVANAVQQQWNTYTEVFTEPRTVFRAIILDALARLAEEDVDVAGAVDLICRNILPQIRSGGETDILTNFRDRMRAISQAEAERQWPNDPHVVTPKLPQIKFGQLNGSAVSINRDTLKAGFPRPPWNNNNWPTHDQQLLEVIQNQGVEAIASTIEAAVKAGGISSDNLKKNLIEPLQNGIQGLVDSVAASLRAATAPITTLRRQADLLWWKEAAFSEHLQQAYRTVPSPLLPLAYAMDFAALLPPWSPVAVEHFLAEAFRTRPVLSSGKSKVGKSNLGTFLDGLKMNAQTPTLLERLSIPPSIETGRSTLLAFISEFSRGGVDQTSLLPRTGLSPELKIDDAEICLYLFREIQALKLVTTEQDGDGE